MYQLTITALLLVISNTCIALHGMNNVIREDNVPDFAVGNEACSGTLISNIVVLTSVQCKKILEGNRTEFYLRRTEQLIEGTAYDNPRYVTDNNYAGKKYFSDVSVVILDKPFSANDVKPIRIPSYAEESSYLIDFIDLRFYGGGRDRYQSEATYQTHYVNAIHDHSVRFRLLAYRPVTYYQEQEPYRLCYDCVHDDDQIFSDNFIIHTYKVMGISNQELNDAFILTAGHYSDSAKYIISPVNGNDLGGTIAYDGEFMGIITDTKVHTRMKKHWPWIIDTVAKHSIDDALHIATQVLGIEKHDIKDLCDNEKCGITWSIGDFYVLKNKDSNELEYFRYIKLISDVYVNLPEYKTSNDYWQYLGTNFPEYIPGITVAN